ncbi:hypothetical protein [Shimia sp.]|uniref:hypothetical protein n=1 Tax=Shimia sp. TaxID=1954381 RepID=UPI003BAADFCB
MNYALLTVDVSARLLGFIGLFAIATFISLAAPTFSSPEIINAIDALVVILIFLKAMEFLLPGKFENAMQDVFVRGSELLNHLANLIFIGALFYLLFRLFDAPASDRQFATALLLMAASAAAALINLLVFMSGFAHKVYADYFDTQSLHTAIYTEAAEPRQQDWLDKSCLYVACLPWMGLTTLTIFSKTIATPQQLAWEQKHEVLLQAAFLGPIALAVAAMIMRPPYQRPDGWKSSRPKAMFGGTVLLALAFASWQLGGKHTLIPTAINVLTNHPKAEKAYVISHAKIVRKMGLCLSLTPLDAKNVTLETCGFSKNDSGSLRPGSTVIFYGELSPYGHTLERHRTKF